MAAKPVYEIVDAAAGVVLLSTRSARKARRRQNKLRYEAAYYRGRVTELRIRPTGSVDEAVRRFVPAADQARYLELMSALAERATLEDLEALCAAPQPVS